MTTTFVIYTPPLASPAPPAPVLPPIPVSSTGLRTFRDAIRQISPSWLQHGYAERILYGLALQLDVLGDMAVAGVKIRFPGLYSYESLGIIGRERRIRRGRTESNAVYGSRLLRWLDDHRRRGGPYAMLAQLFAHYAPDNFQIDLVYRSGRRFSMNADGAIVRDDLGTFTTAAWAHWTLYYFWPDVVNNDGAWSDAGTWSDGGVWDSNLTLEDIIDIRLIPREWNAQHCFGRVVLLTAGIELWDYPAGLWSDPGLWLDPEVTPVQLSIG